MKVEVAISVLAEAGLNIFLSTKVSNLPNDIFNFSEVQKAKTLCLVGHGGKKLWENLPHPLPLNAHSIDDFSKKKMQEFAASALNDLEIEILFPNDNYTLPLQKLGRFFNLSAPTPMGIDLCEDYGPWFAYRGAFLTSASIPEHFKTTFLSPCTECEQRPCLIRRALCPIKQEHQYTQAQIDYHATQLTLIRC